MASVYRPPFQITNKIINLISQIQENIGELKSYVIAKPSIKLRKENKIRTIRYSLAIEGNSLDIDQVTAILENKRVLGPQKQIVEVKNAIKLYNSIQDLDALVERDFLKAHQVLMKGLVEGAGKYRSQQVGITKGGKLGHLAPPPSQVSKLMKQLFQFLKSDKETPWLIKACACHYEIEFIHPFTDGNGRMGRLWQQLLLMKQSSLFEFLPVETLVHSQQKQYYKALELSDKAGDSSNFIEFSLEIILKSIEEFNSIHRLKKPKDTDRISYALEKFQTNSFSRKDYLLLFSGISTATASRDLAMAVANRLLIKSGDKALSTYRFKV